jgi:hypothetical protein
MGMKHAVMRMQPSTAVPTVIPNQNDLSRLFTGKINKTNGKVLRKIVTLPHENAKLIGPVRRLKSHFVSFHLAVNPHLATKWLCDILDAGNEAYEFIVREHPHVRIMLGKTDHAKPFINCDMNWFAGTAKKTALDIGEYQLPNLLLSSLFNSFPVGPFGISVTIRIVLGHL